MLGSGVLIALVGCSTPYGIGGGGIQANAQLAGVLDGVLNALRHLRLRHSRVLFTISGVWGAQRLTASEVEAFRSAHSDAALTICAQRLTASEVEAWEWIETDIHGAVRAQRLTASEVEAYLPLRRRELLPRVLNALRHLRLRHLASLMRSSSRSECSTPYGIGGGGIGGFFLRPIAASWVLNALRHLRLRHAFLITKVMPLVRAQRLTASEVEAFLTGDLLSFGLQVLNALRHLRLRHTLPPQAEQVLQQCSTPYGIGGGGIGRNIFDGFDFDIVLNALRHLRLRHNHTPSRAGNPGRCSTPYGIGGGGISPWPIAHFWLALVLNALRHLRLRHGTMSPSSFCDECAQRLTASEVEAYPESFAKLQQGIVLNALRHLRLRHHFTVQEKTGIITGAQRLTASEVEAFLSQSPCASSRACSTPYGIGGGGIISRKRNKVFFGVLNALRHLRLRHDPASKYAILSIACAQRLTASEVEA